jgi:cytosine/adenosine deaminase-related metal-dependent hydrolase
MCLSLPELQPRANALENQVGTLMPGKEADLILLHTNMVNVMPINDPIGAVLIRIQESLLINLPIHKQKMAIMV